MESDCIRIKLLVALLSSNPIEMISDNGDMAEFRIELHASLALRSKNVDHAFLRTK